MASFYEDIEPDLAVEIELLAQLIYELRENRAAILQPYGVENETLLLQQIQSGAVDEHPAYEHYLSARILADTREAVRATIAEHLKEASRK